MKQSVIQINDGELHQKIKMSAFEKGHTTLKQFIKIALKEGLHALKTGDIYLETPERRFNQRPKK